MCHWSHASYFEVAVSNMLLHSLDSAPAHTDFAPGAPEPVTIPRQWQGASGLRGSRLATSSMAWVTAGSKLAIPVSKGASPGWLQSVKNSPLTRKCPTTSDNAWDFLTEAWETGKGLGVHLLVKVLTSRKSYHVCMLSHSVMTDSLWPFGL